MASTAEIPFPQLLDALLDADKPYPPRLLYRLSDLEPDEIAILDATWQKIPDWRRRALMEDIEELGEGDTLLSFEAMGRFALKDSDAYVRKLAIETLWDFEKADLAPIFIKLAETDSDAQVRATAAGALGRYVYAGELDRLSKRFLHKVEDCLIRIIQGKDDEKVRRSALEAIGYSSLPEASTLIETSFASDDRAWKASAVCAMGNSADERWTPQVLSMLNNKQPALRSEAARAAGELEIHQAVPGLIELLDDPDDETRLASIWALSQIGGTGVREKLEKLYAHTDNELDLQALEEALDNLSFTEGLGYMPLIDIPDEEEDEAEEDDLFFDEEDEYFLDYEDDLD